MSRTFGSTLHDCWNCEHFDKGSDGIATLEEYEEAQPPSCWQGNLAELSEENENAAVLIQELLFTLSSLRHCPLKRPKSLRRPRLGRGMGGSYRSIEK